MCRNVAYVVWVNTPSQSATILQKGFKWKKKEHPRIYMFQLLPRLYGGISGENSYGMITFKTWICVTNKWIDIYDLMDSFDICILYVHVAPCSSLGN